jgi:uncharacterized coiled-coil DUF342 family protein
MTSLEDQIQTVRDHRDALESKTQELHELQVAFNQQHSDLINAKCKAASDCSEEAARRLSGLGLKVGEIEPHMGQRTVVVRNGEDYLVRAIT